MKIDEQRVRELAYQIWESEGRPQGHTDRHWEMACKLLESEQLGELQPAPAQTKTKRAPRAKKAPQLPSEDETQLERPALLGKPTGAEKPKTLRKSRTKAAATEQETPAVLGKNKNRKE